MNNKYTNATKLEDLLQDDFFLKSILEPSEETNRFWNALLEEGLLDPEIFAEAKRQVLEADSLSQMSDREKDYLWGRIIRENSILARRKKVVRIAVSVTAVAAVFLLLLVTTRQFVFPDSKVMSKGEISDVEPDFRSDKIQLITSNEGPIEISGREAVIDYSSSDSVIVNGVNVSERKESENQAIVYNEVVVPYGKRSEIILSDNTKLWINAGSRVKYPVKFAKDKREIFVEGEVYADVAKDPSRQFVFKTSKLDVTVLGTSLNVRAYRGQADQRVVLVTGSVKVMPETHKEMLLVPNQMYSYSDGMSQVQNVNTKNYTSWISGYYAFDDEKLDVILKSISQYYGVKIKCLSPKTATYSGNLELKDDMAEVLSGLCYVLSMEYKYENESYILIRK